MCTSNIITKDVSQQKKISFWGHILSLQHGHDIFIITKLHIHTNIYYIAKFINGLSRRAKQVLPVTQEPLVRHRLLQRTCMCTHIYQIYDKCMNVFAFKNDFKNHCPLRATEFVGVWKHVQLLNVVFTQLYGQSFLIINSNAQKFRCTHI